MEQRKPYNLGPKLRALGYSTYAEYLRSDHWQDVRRRYRASKLKKDCYVCRSKGPCDLHHRSYKRLGRENLHDLLPLCRGCHEATHRLLREEFTGRGKLNIFTAAKILRRRARETPNGPGGPPG